MYTLKTERYENTGALRGRRLYINGYPNRLFACREDIVDWIQREAKYHTDQIEIYTEKQREHQKELKALISFLLETKGGFDDGT